MKQVKLRFTTTSRSALMFLIFLKNGFFENFNCFKIGFFLENLIFLGKFDCFFENSNFWIFFYFFKNLEFFQYFEKFWLSKLQIIAVFVVLFLFWAIYMCFHFGWAIISNWQFRHIEASTLCGQINPTLDTPSPLSYLT